MNDEKRTNRASDSDTDGRVELRSYASRDEESLVPLLSTSLKPGWGNAEQWRWKHLQRPGFRPDEVVTAYVDGQLAACFHGATLPLKLEPGLVVQMSFDGDFAVLPELRGKRIPSRAHDLTDRRLLERHVDLRGDFTSKELNERFYRKQFGYVFIPTETARVRKVLGLTPLQHKVEALGKATLKRPDLRRSFEKGPLIINFTVEQFKPFYLDLSGDAFRLVPGHHEDADLSVKAPYSLLLTVSRGQFSFVKSALSNLLMGRLRVSGLFRTRSRLLTLLWFVLRRR